MNHQGNAQTHDLIEHNGQLGYFTAAGFVSVCDLKQCNSSNTRGYLSNFLLETPNMREDATLGLLKFTVEGDMVYCHPTEEYYKKHCSPGSPTRRRAIESWQDVYLTSDQREQARRPPIAVLEGDALDAWARNRVAEHERSIAQIKNNGGHAPKSCGRIELL